VISGSTLVFSPSSWNTYQTVTLAAADDANVADESAIFRIQASGVPDKEITATSIDDDALNFITDTNSVIVPEGGTAAFRVRLNAPPPSSVSITVSRAPAGDLDITVQSGSLLTFTPSDWSVYQAVTLRAAEDADSTNGTAVIRIRDQAGNIPDLEITAVESDNDIFQGNVALLLDPSEASSGQDVGVSVSISDNDQPLSQFGLDFTYDQSFFSFQGIQVGSLTSDWQISSRNVQPGAINVTGTSGSLVPAMSSGSLVTLLLQVKCLGFDVDTPSTLTVENYTGDLESGFTPEPAGVDFTYKPCPRLGDVNGDGSVTPGDAQEAFEIFLGLLNPTSCQEMASDADCSAATTPGDAQDIFEHFLGVISLPECCDEVGQALIQLRAPGVRFPGYPGGPVRRRLLMMHASGRPGTTVRIPLVVTNPWGIRTFRVGVNYPEALLEYLGTVRTPMTRSFARLEGIREQQGLVIVEGETSVPMESSHPASLALLVFRVREGGADRMPIHLLQPGGDLFGAELREGTFSRREISPEIGGSIFLGRAVPLPGRLVKIPVKVHTPFPMKAFGMEFRYTSDSLLFVGMENPYPSESLASIRGEEVGPGLVRVGGYGMDQFRPKSSRALFELVFLKTGRGEVELTRTFDDAGELSVRKARTRVE